MNEPTMTDAEYQAALDRLAEYEKHLISAGNYEQRGSLDYARDLAFLFHDPAQRWVAERNAERAATAKTERGGRPVDPSSRSQFSTWLRGRYRGIDPSRVYQLLEAQRILVSFLDRVEITPTSEKSLRPLKTLTRVAYGSGSRIAPIWELACVIAGNKAPTAEQVRQAITQWNRENIPQGIARQEATEDRLRRKRYRAQEKIDELFIDAKTHPDHASYVIEQMETLARQLEEDIAALRKLR